jgi:hypothetical protein
MHSSPFILTNSGDKRYFGRHPEDDYRYSYSSERYSSDSKFASVGPERHSMPTPIAIEPHENDVLMGRGGRNNQHSGNELLRQFARAQGEKYRIASKKGKSAISRYLVRQMRGLDPPAR